MSYQLIISQDGIAYAGRVLENVDSDQWLGLQPSPKSGVRIFFCADVIASIYQEDGTYINFKPVESCASNRVQIPNGPLALYRVQGNISFRGLPVVKPENLPQEQPGCWVMPVGEKAGILLFLPENEIEGTFHA